MPANLRALSLIPCSVLGLVSSTPARAAELKVRGTGTSTPLLAVLAKELSRRTQAAIAFLTSPAGKAALRTGHVL